MANSKFMESLEVQKLRSSIYFLLEERNRTNNKLIGVQVLTDQLQQKNAECMGLKSKLQQVEVLLSRAENRIAQLSVVNGKGGSASHGGIVTPGVSKKLLETITRENTKLKLALEHVLNKQPSGVDLAVENRDLHDLVIALKDELQQNRKETEELREALKAVETDDSMALQQQIARLTAQVTDVERSLKAKQVYCESVVSENERLKSNMEAVKSERITQLATLKKLSGQHPAIRDVLDVTWSGDDVDGQTKDIEKYTKEIESLKKTIEEFKIQRTNSFEESKKHHEEYERQIQELTHTNAMMHEEMEKMKNEFQEVNVVKELLEGQCKDFENDFKMERQEKEKLDSDMKRLVKQYKDLQQENEKVNGENDKIKKMIKAECERKQQKQHETSPTTSSAQQSRWQGSAAATGYTALPTTSTPQQSRWQGPVVSPGYMPAHYNPTIKNQDAIRADHAARYAPPHFNPMNYGSGQVCADGPGENIKPYSRINQGTSSYLECPVCKMILPPTEIEDHLNDCDGRK